MTQPSCGAAIAQAQPLSGRGILVTRPAQQAQPLAELVRQQGGRAILFPVLEILDATDPGPLNALIDRLDEFGLAIFISPNAVNKAMNLIKARRELPTRMQIATIGRGSEKELKHFGIDGVIAPAAKFDSEGLLALPEMHQVAGKRVVIFRGEGGRELLGDTLKARGATVEYAECYRRGKPDADAAALLHLWARGELSAVTVTSADSLRNLYDMLGKLGREWLKKTPLFVPHQRIAQVARELGLAEVVVTPLGDEAMVRELTAWFENKK